MFAGTSFKTVAPAPILTLSLTSISPIIIAFAPISTLFPIFGDPPCLSLTDCYILSYYAPISDWSLIPDYYAKWMTK